VSSGIVSVKRPELKTDQSASKRFTKLLYSGHVTSVPLQTHPKAVVEKRIYET